MEGKPFENISPEKREAWQNIRESVDHLADRLGKGVDSGVKDMVAILNLMELPTDGSCEGHLHNDSKAPWIDFDFIPGKLRQEIHQARLNLPQGEKTSSQLEALRNEAKLKLLKGQARILQLLDEFYGERPRSAESRLGITFYPARARLESQGAHLQDLHAPEMQAKKLRAYQEEMQDFAEFLKAKFFADSLME